jgi:hypothetical protein
MPGQEADAMREARGWLVPLLIAGGALAPAPAWGLCAVEGKLEAIRFNVDEALAFVVHVRQPNSVVPNAFHVERQANGGLGDIPTLIQLLGQVNPANASVLVVSDLSSCPDATDLERARSESRAVPSGRLLRVFVKYR